MTNQVNERPMRTGSGSLNAVEFLISRGRHLAPTVESSGPQKTVESLVSVAPVLSRSSDPETSRVAGENSKEFRARHISKIWAVLKDFGPMNKNEIAVKTGLDPVQVARRGKEMELNHLVSIGPEVKDGCRLWRAIC